MRILHAISFRQVRTLRPNLELPMNILINQIASSPVMESITMSLQLTNDVSAFTLHAMQNCFFVISHLLGCMINIIS